MRRTQKWKSIYFVCKKFFNICVLFQCMVYWINFQNMYTFTYQKTLLHTLLLLVFKIVEILQFIDCNWIRTHNHLVHKRTLNHLAKLAKWLSCVVSTYLYGAFERCICTVHLWIHSETRTWHDKNIQSNAPYR